MSESKQLKKYKSKKQPKDKSSSYFSCILSSIMAKIINNKDNVAILKLQGIISSQSMKLSNNISLDSLRESINEAFNLKKLKAVILQIDCPGGSPVQSELIYQYIKMKSEETKIPVFSFIEDVAASGGLYLAYISDEVFASNSSIIGSIGVRSSGFGFQEAIKKLGIERRIYTQGKNKVILDPFLPEKESDVKIINKIQKNIHEDFKNFVLQRRGNKLSDNHDHIFSGEFWSAKDALEFGLIDHIDNMYKFIKEKFGEKINIKKINLEKSWFKRKFINSMIDFVFNKIILLFEEKIERIKLGL